MSQRNVILCGDVRERLRDLDDESVHCVVTSPPYWGLRDYKTDGQLGLEATPEEFVANMVAVFREVHRVLRKDGTLWLNLGDSYAGSGRGTNADGSQGKNGEKQQTNRGANLDFHDRLVAEGSIGRFWKAPPAGLKVKDLVGIPWRLAFALQADGWWLRSDIIWSKPNPMPESVTDRPTKAHEYLFLLTKASTYYYDAEAIKETTAVESGWVKQRAKGFDTWEYTRKVNEYGPNNTNGQGGTDGGLGTRNRRTVWEIATEPYVEAHFATFPTELVKPCILAGTSEYGCCSVCGALWERVVETSRSGFKDRSDRLVATGGAITGGVGRNFPDIETRTTGWRPTCKHEAPTIPAIVLDPFMGSGTVGLVAKTAGRDYIGVELNPEYIEMAEKRINVDQERLL